MAAGTILNQARVVHPFRHQHQRQRLHQYNGGWKKVGGCSTKEVMDNLSSQNPNLNTAENQAANSFKKFLSPKIIFVILGIIFLVEVVYIARTLLLSSSSQPSPTPAKTNVSQGVKKTGSISLTAGKETVVLSEALPVTVYIDTGGNKITGVDLIVKYDPKALEASSAGLITGQIFDEYPLKSVDSDKGLISISGLSSAKTSFLGSGQFARINFKPKVPGKTAVTVDFQKGSTTDSNMVEVTESKDILENITNLELSIQ